MTWPLCNLLNWYSLVCAALIFYSFCNLFFLIMYYVVYFKQGKSGSNNYNNFYSDSILQNNIEKWGLSLSSDYLRRVRKIVFWPETVWRHFCSTTGQILIKDTQSVENGRPKDMRPQRIERFSALLYKRYGLLQGLLNNWKWKVQKIWRQTEITGIFYTPEQTLLSYSRTPL